MRCSRLPLLLALLTMPISASAADENVTPRLRGALVEFESGTTYAFYSRGGFVMMLADKTYRGKWWFKKDRSAFCGTVTMSAGPETSCSSIVRRGSGYVEMTEKGEVGASPIIAIKFNKFRK